MESLPFVQEEKVRKLSLILLMNQQILSASHNERGKEGIVFAGNYFKRGN